MTAYRAYRNHQINRVVVVEMDYLDNYHHVIYSMERRCRHYNIQKRFLFDDLSASQFECMQCGDIIQ